MTPRRMEPISNEAAPPVRRPVATRVTVSALAIGLVVGTLVAVTAVKATSSTGSEDCPTGEPPLRIVAVPEVADVISRVVQETGERVRDCPLPMAIIADDAATTAAAIRDESIDRPDVWIPDSSAWTERASTPGTGLPDNNPSVASSPLTLAVPAQVAKGINSDGKALTLADLLPASPDVAGPVRWVLPAPDRSAGTVGALLGLKAAAADHADSSALLGTVIRASSPDPITLAALSKSSPKLGVAVSEQQLYAHNVSQPNRTLVAAYPRADGFAFDYPYIVLAAERTRRAQANDLLKSLQSEDGLRLFAAAGFRSTTGASGPELAAVPGLDAAKDRAGKVPDATSVDSAIAAYDRVVRPSRLLAVIDASGSMGKTVPGSRGATRLDLAVQASLSGLAVYPDEAAVGLWIFSTDLTAKTDYRKLAKVSPLGRGADGISGRERMVQALAKVGVQKGRTGLYDTVLAAVRDVRRTWDPDRVNSVVVITDGADSDRHTIGLDRLLAQLRKENDPKRPVAVFAIAYGPTGDLGTLTKISEATGGRAYAAPDPRMISRVMADAIGRRACSPDC